MCWSAAILNKLSKESTSSITMKAKILKCINICKNFCKENLCSYILKVFIYKCLLLQQYILCASSSWQATSTTYASPSYLSHHIIPSQKKSPVPKNVYKVKLIKCEQTVKNQNMIMLKYIPLKPVVSQKYESWMSNTDKN